MSDIKFESWTEAQMWGRFAAALVNRFVSEPEHITSFRDDGDGPRAHAIAQPPDESAAKYADKMLLAFRERVKG